MKRLRWYWLFLALFLYVIGVCALLIAWINLIGFPMLEARAMSRGTGFIAFGIAFSAMGWAEFFRRRYSQCR